MEDSLNNLTMSIINKSDNIEWGMASVLIEKKILDLEKSLEEENKKKEEYLKDVNDVKCLNDYDAGMYEFYQTSLSQYYALLNAINNKDSSSWLELMGF